MRGPPEGAVRAEGIGFDPVCLQLYSLYAADSRCLRGLRLAFEALAQALQEYAKHTCHFVTTCSCLLPHRRAQMTKLMSRSSSLNNRVARSSTARPGSILDDSTAGCPGSGMLPSGTHSSPTIDATLKAVPSRPSLRGTTSSRTLAALPAAAREMLSKITARW